MVGAPARRHPGPLREAAKPTEGTQNPVRRAVEGHGGETWVEARLPVEEGV